MFGHYRNSGIPSIRSYAEALDLYNTTKPIRGRTDNEGNPIDLRPLGHRRNTWYALEMDGEDVLCVLYTEPVVRFKPNGEVHITNLRYNTVSTGYFIDEVFRGQRVRARIFDRSLVVKLGDTSHRVSNIEGLKLGKDESGNYHSLSPETNFRYRLNRKEANNVRQKYADVIASVVGIAKLRTDTAYTYEEFTNNGLGDVVSLRNTWNTEGCSEALHILWGFIHDTNPETRALSMFKTTLMLANAHGGYDFRTRGNLLTPSQAGKALEIYLMGFNRDAVLTRTEIDNGKVTRGKYNKYFVKQWERFYTAK